MAADTRVASLSRSTGSHGSRGACVLIQPGHSRIDRSTSGNCPLFRNRAIASGSGAPFGSGASARSAAASFPGLGLGPRASRIRPARASSPPMASDTSCLIVASGSSPPGRISAGSLACGQMLAAVSTSPSGATPSRVRAVRAGPGRSARRAAEDSSARVRSGVRPTTAPSTEPPVVVTSRPRAGESRASRSTGRAGSRRRHSERLASIPSAR